jgi:hypothetical protein
MKVGVLKYVDDLQPGWQSAVGERHRSAFARVKIKWRERRFYVGSTDPILPLSDAAFSLRAEDRFDLSRGGRKIAGKFANGIPAEPH